MKNILLTFMLLFIAGTVMSQKEKATYAPQIGDKAPAFRAESSMGTVNFPSDYGNSWKIIFSHPLNFTPVCSSELLELAYMQGKFEDLGVKILVVSTDTKERHLLWKGALEDITWHNVPTRINFPLIDDSKMDISKSYGMIHSRVSTTENVRGVFVIGPDNIIRSTIFYPMQVGRNMNEILRAVEAIQVAENNNLLTPVNWESGGDLLVPYFPYRDSDVAANPDIVNDYYQVGHLLWYKKTNGQ